MKLKALAITHGIVLSCLVLFIVLIQMDPNRIQQENRQRIEGNIRSRFPVGSDSRLIIAYLKQDGFRFSHLSAPNHIQSIKRDTSLGFLTTGDVEVVFYLDRNNKLVRYTTRDVFTGP